MKKPARALRSDASVSKPNLKAAPHAVRIIAGKWRRSKLPVLDAEGLRPTPDRVRETVFNWISHFRPEGLERARVLDLFAGSGALGLEAASRGARDVTLVDNSAPVIEALKVTLARLGDVAVSVKRQDAATFIAQAGSAGARFDVVFLDPPFRAGWLERVLGPVVEVTAAGGLIYIEAESALAEQLADRYALSCLRKDKAGQVVYHLLRRNIAAAGSGPTNTGDAAC
jgi:16S rRNA (guanine(966)-N(2))-methyltransferase RsmD